VFVNLAGARRIKEGTALDLTNSVPTTHPYGLTARLHVAGSGVLIPRLGWATQLCFEPAGTTTHGPTYWGMRASRVNLEIRRPIRAPSSPFPLRY
jgi:hypothetical protein